MAGASIRITLDDQQAREVLARLRRASADLERVPHTRGDDLSRCAFARPGAIFGLQLTPCLKICKPSGRSA